MAWSLPQLLATITRRHVIVVAATVLNAILAILATTAAVLSGLLFNVTVFIIAAIAVAIFACGSLIGFLTYYRRLDEEIC